MSQLKCVIGVDVGTGSARAALVTSTGQLLKSCVKATQTWNPLPDHYEQSSDNIWSAVCECVRVSNDLQRAVRMMGRLVLCLFLCS